MKTQTKNTIIKLLKLSGITLAVYLFMRFILPVVIPFLLALAIAAALRPAVKKLCSKTSLREKHAVTIVFLLFLLIFLAILAGLSYLLYRQTGNLMEHASSFDSNMDYWCGLCQNSICKLCGKENPELGRRLADGFEGIVNSLGKRISGFAMQCSVSSLKSIAGFFTVVLITFISTLLILHDFERLGNLFQDSSLGSAVSDIMKNICHAGGSYLLAQLKIMGIITAICIVGLFLSGNRYAIIAGILIGICDALPFLGTGTVFIPWAFIDLLQQQYSAAFLHIILYLVCLISRQYLEPKIIGKGMGIHPLLIIMSIYIGVCIYGASGIILGPASALLIREIYDQL